MAVYVDMLWPVPPGRRWKWNQACHMFADTPEDLHVMAEQIGLKRAWFQNQPGHFPHYDLTEGVRTAAVRAGAVEVDRRTTYEHIKRAQAKEAEGG